MLARYTPVKAMTGKSLEKNIKVKIGLLEAKVIFKREIYHLVNVILLDWKGYINFMVQSCRE